MCAQAVAVIAAGGRCSRVTAARVTPAITIAAMAVLVLLGLARVSWAVSPAELPPSIQALPMDKLLRAFSISWEPPNLAAEIARERAWHALAPDDIAACPALARVIHDYGGTSDARRALLDIAGAYARAGDWRTAEAPFRYVMEIKEGHPEARIARFRLVEMYRYAGATPPVDPVAECQSAVEACLGTPEEGLGRMLLGDMLADNGHAQAAFAEFDRVLSSFPNQPYTSYTRIRYAVALSNAGQAERAIEVVSPVLADPLWGGRAHWARAKACATKGATKEAMRDLLTAAQTADNLSLRGDYYVELAGLYDGQGDRERGSEYLAACLHVYPYHPQRLQMRIELVRRMFERGAYVEAAQAALELETEVQHSTRYSKAEIADTSRVCDDMLDKCERRLLGASRTRAR